MVNTNLTTYLGIDPGKSGGLVAITGKTIAACPMPDTEVDIWHWFATLFRSGDKGLPRTVVAVIEKVGGFVGKDQPGSRMFNFGWGYGGLRMALIAAGIPFDEVTPQKWQKAMGCMTKGDKLISLRKAQQLYPDYPLWRIPKTKGKQLSIADALLLATYIKRKEQGTL